MVVEIFQDNFFLPMLLGKWRFSKFDDSIASSMYTSVFYDAIVLLSRIKNNSLHILV